LYCCFATTGQFNKQQQKKKHKVTFITLQEKKENRFDFYKNQSKAGSCAAGIA